MVEIAATLFVIIVGLYIGAWVLFGVFALIGAVLNEPPLPPEPRVEDKPYLQLQNLRTLEDHVLSTYAWVDETAGTVRIPVDRAMDIVAQKGLPYHNYLDDITKGSKNAKQ